MREVQVHSWCDLCWARDETREPAVVTRVVQLDRHSARALDLCETDDKALLGELIIALDEHAHKATDEDMRRVPKLSSGAGAARAVTPLANDPVSCPVCDRPLGSRHSLIGHIWSKHAATDRPDVKLGKCPDCAERYDTPQGMGAHRSAMHAYDPLEEALAAVPGLAHGGRSGKIATPSKSTTAGKAAGK